MLHWETLGSHFSLPDGSGRPLQVLFERIMLVVWKFTSNNGVEIRSKVLITFITQKASEYKKN